MFAKLLVSTRLGRVAEVRNNLCVVAVHAEEATLGRAVHGYQDAGRATSRQGTGQGKELFGRGCFGVTTTQATTHAARLMSLFTSTRQQLQMIISSIDGVNLACIGKGGQICLARDLVGGWTITPNAPMSLRMTPGCFTSVSPNSLSFVQFVPSCRMWSSGGAWCSSHSTFMTGCPPLNGTKQEEPSKLLVGC